MPSSGSIDIVLERLSWGGTTVLYRYFEASLELWQRLSFLDAGSVTFDLLLDIPGAEDIYHLAKEVARAIV